MQDQGQEARLRGDRMDPGEFLYVQKNIHTAQGKILSPPLLTFIKSDSKPKWIALASLLAGHDQIL